MNQKKRHKIDWRVCGVENNMGGPLHGNCPQCTSLPICPHVKALAQYYTDRTNPGILTYARMHLFFSKYLQPQILKHGKRAGVNALVPAFYNHLLSIVRYTRDDPRMYGKAYASRNDLEEAGFKRETVRYIWPYLTGGVKGLEHINVIRRVPGLFNKKTGGVGEMVLWELLLFTQEDKIREAVAARIAEDKDEEDEATGAVVTMHRQQTPPLVIGLDGPIATTTPRGRIITVPNLGRKLVK